MIFALLQDRKFIGTSSSQNFQHMYIDLRYIDIAEMVELELDIWQGFLRMLRRKNDIYRGRIPWLPL